MDRQRVAQGETSLVHLRPMLSEFLLNFLDGEKGREHTLTGIKESPRPAGSQETKHQFVIYKRTGVFFLLYRVTHDEFRAVQCEVPGNSPSRQTILLRVQSASQLTLGGSFIPAPLSPSSILLPITWIRLFTIFGMSSVSFQSTNFLKRSNGIR